MRVQTVQVSSWLGLIWDEVVTHCNLFRLQHLCNRRIRCILHFGQHIFHLHKETGQKDNLMSRLINPFIQTTFINRKIQPKMFDGNARLDLKLTTNTGIFIRPIRTVIDAITLLPVWNTFCFVFNASIIWGPLVCVNYVRNTLEFRWWITSLQNWF